MALLPELEGVYVRIGLALATALASALLYGCSGASTSIRTAPGTTHPSPTTGNAFTGPPLDTILVAIHRLEQFPMAEDALANREMLMGWIITTPGIGEIDASPPFMRRLLESTHPYRAELQMQYIFGAAVWNVGNGGAQPDTPVATIEAGLRSLLAAYKGMITIDPQLRFDFLDDLDETRKQGELHNYVERAYRMGKEK